MTNTGLLKKIVFFPLTRMLAGLLVVGTTVFLCEMAGDRLLGALHLDTGFKTFLIALLDASAALLSYVLLYRFYEQRDIQELSLPGFRAGAAPGFLTGLLLQSLCVAVIYLARDYDVVRLHRPSALLSGLSASLTAGFVAEIMIIGVFFRLLEQWLGTAWTMGGMSILFAVLHGGGEATLLSVLATVVNAAILLPACYVCFRSLWWPIFLHFAWDFTGPAVFGVANPSLSVSSSLIDCKLSGPVWLTGGTFGPGHSIQSMLFCGAAALIFLWRAKKAGRFRCPFWHRRKTNAPGTVDSLSGIPPLFFASPSKATYLNDHATSAGMHPFVANGWK